MRLGEGIPPVVPDADEIVSDGESAAVLREILSSLSLVAQQLVAATTRLGALVDQHQASAESLASAARTLAMRLTLPAPEVNVTVPTPSVTVDAPVTVMPEPESTAKKVSRTRVIRDADGLITELIEEEED